MLKNLNFVGLKNSLNVLKNESYKSFKDIPGPKGVLGIGNFYNYFNVFGKYRFDELHKANYDKYLRYGPIVCEHIFRNVPIVWLYDPNDIAQIFQHDLESHPCRVSHFAFQKYRMDNPKLYKGGGIIMANGEEWRRLRSCLQKGFNTNDICDFLPHVDEVIKEYITTLPKTSNENSATEIISEMERVSLEIICHAILGVRLNCFSELELKPDSISSRVIKVSAENLKAIALTDQFPQLWRYFETKDYKTIKRASHIVENFLIEKVFSKNGINKESIIKRYFYAKMLEKREIFGFSADSILTLHSLAYTLSFILYHISKHKNVQDLMHQEAKRVLNNFDDSIDINMLKHKIPYTRAVFKEASRLNPLTIGIARIIPRDQILSGYFVPKNTLVMTQNYIACRLEENFEDPLKFKPERWLDLHEKMEIHPYLTMPFGSGLRSCIGKRFALQVIYVLLIRLLRNYTLEWAGDNGDLEFKTLLVNIPSEKFPVKIQKR